MSAVKSVEDRANELAQLIEDRLGIRGHGLEAKLRRAGRALPRRVRRDARAIADAVPLAASPKLMRQVDPARIETAFRRCEAWLKTVDPNRRRIDAFLGILAVNAFNFLVIAGAVIAYLVWSGRL